MKLHKAFYVHRFYGAGNQTNFKSVIGDLKSLCYEKKVKYNKKALSMWM